MLNLNSEVTITNPSNLLVFEVHNESWNEHPDDDVEEGSATGEEINKKPDLKTQHHDSSYYVDNSDRQKPTFKLHSIINSYINARGLSISIRYQVKLVVADLPKITWFCCHQGSPQPGGSCPYEKSVLGVAGGTWKWN